MPPFIPVKCPHCQQQNSFDKAQLDAVDVGAKGTVFRGEEPQAQEYRVTCSFCQRSFKLRLKEGSHE